MTAHYVYRCFDVDKRLLYVGQTKNAPSRLAQHQRAFWAAQVAKVKVEVYPTPEIARAAERTAIRDEDPRFNLQGRRPQQQWTRDNYTDLLLVFADGDLTRPTEKWQWVRMRSLLSNYARAFGEQHPDADRLEPLFQQLAEKRRADNEADELRRARERREMREREAEDRREHNAHCCACMYGINVDDAVIAQFADEAGKRTWAEMFA